MNESAAPPALLALHGVTKRFGQRIVLDDVSLEIPAGQRTVILGPSGAGKSVLLRHLVGLIKPDVGEVWFDGQRIDRLSERRLAPVRRQVSYIFQLNALFDSLTVEDNVALPLLERGTDVTAAHRHVQVALEAVGLDGYRKKLPAELSGGEQKRVALARAIAAQPPPRAILYDEPTAGLDPPRAAAITDLICALETRLGVMSVVVTHDLRAAAALDGHCVMLDSGRVVAQGSLGELGQSPDARVQRFVGLR